MELKCYRCKKYLPLSGFYANKAQHRGYSGWCKNCWKEHRNKPAFKKKNRIYFRKYYQNKENREKYLERQRIYYKNNKTKFREKEKVQREKFPGKFKARWKLQAAVRSGKIERGVCSVCGKENAEAHHDDYSKPFVVKWFCKFHHFEYARLSRGQL